MMRAQQKQHQQEQENEQTYDVQFVYGKSRSAKEPEVRYAVKWDGWSMADMSWEPIENFVNNTALCVRRFERCQAYQQYYQRIKKSTTKGIRIHVLGQYSQAYVPNLLHIKLKPGNIKNSEVKPIIRKKIHQDSLQPDQLSKTTEKFQQTPPSQEAIKGKSLDRAQLSPSRIDVETAFIPSQSQQTKAPERLNYTEELENNSHSRSYQEQAAKADKAQKTVRKSEIVKPTQKDTITKVQEQEKEKEIQKVPKKHDNKKPSIASQPKQPDLVQKEEEIDDANMNGGKEEQGKFSGKFSYGSFGGKTKKQQLQTKIETKKDDDEESFPHYGVNNNGLIFQRVGPSARDHLNGRQSQPVRPPSNRFKLLQSTIQDTNGQTAPREKQHIKTERDYLNEIINAQRLKEQNMKQQTNDQSFNMTKVQYPDQFGVKIAEQQDNTKIKMQDGNEIKQIEPFGLVEKETQTTDEAQQETQNFYSKVKDLQGFIKIIKDNSIKQVKVKRIVNHKLGQIENERRVQLVLQVELDGSNQELYTTYNFLRDNEIEQLLEYCLKNSILQ